MSALRSSYGNKQHCYIVQFISSDVEKDSYKDGDGDASFQLKSDSLPHAHAKTTKTYYKHQDSRIKKAQELKDKDFRTNSDIQDLPSKISSLSREIVSKLSR
ncbi:hypothetical protein Tco_0312587 [Tanacetum coccineum]